MRKTSEVARAWSGQAVTVAALPLMTDPVRSVPRVATCSPPARPTLAKSLLVVCDNCSFVLCILPLILLKTLHASYSRVICFSPNFLYKIRRIVWDHKFILHHYSRVSSGGGCARPDTCNPLPGECLLRLRDDLKNEHLRLAYLHV